MHSRPVVRVLSILLCAGVLGLAARHADVPGLRVAIAATPANGLKGHYYSRHPGADYAGLYDEFRLLSKPRSPPDAVRIDPQIAFARPRITRYDQDIPRLEWWTPAKASAVIWKGYLRLPKAGTYYLTTISHGASAVFLNKSRVALNAPFGGAIREDAFTYGDVGAPDVSSYATGHYAVPVTVSGPRDFPIEVQHEYHSYSGWIDLYWVTPDSPRNAAGKPIAQLVPTEALFVEAPGPIAEARVSGPHSTISSDVLYLSTKADSPATLTIRVADKQGRPVSGKRVHVSNLASYGGKDTIVQPEAPTNDQGVVTARVKPTDVGHTAKFFATVLDEGVDIGQVAEIEVFSAGNLSFMPAGFAPYYNEQFRISPRPLVVGQKTTITVPLSNPLKVSVELSVRFLNSMANIGGSNWTKIGETEKFVLKAGENKEVSITWTPLKEEGHLCFVVEVWGRELPQKAASNGLFRLISSANAQQDFRLPTLGGENFSLLDRRQQNVGTVTNLTDYGMDKNYWKGVEERSKNVVAICKEVGLAFGGVAAVTKLADEVWARKEILIRAGKYVTKKGAAQITILAGGICGWAGTTAGIGHWIASDPPDLAFQEVYTPYNYQFPPPTRSETVPEPYVAVWDASLRNQFEIVSLSTAVLVSLERHQGAEIAGDPDAAHRQLLAYFNYTNQVAQRFERGATLLESLVAASRAAGIADIVLTAEQVRAAQQQLASTGFNDDSLAVFAWLGVSQEFLDEYILPVALRADPDKAAGSYSAKLLELAAAYRWAGAGLARKAQFTYVVGNPHEREEDVDLRIHRASMPPEWNVSIIDAAPTLLEKSKNPQIQQVEAGKLYRVRLPAKGEMRVSAELVPVGMLAENTTARWAIEGKIGDELLGGIVQEMHVPATVADLESPAIGSADTQSSAGPLAGATVFKWPVLWISAGITLLLGVVVLVFFWRRRHAHARRD